ncbi:MAG: [FeFe] hydrogenase H-cluster radical SAM maturase HydE, partial [Lachnospiraceae bacterium]|nr:[FeFe] hydrogenase H-cluster radical SAM maturase HydE [Lachnospiraceae bacterium]
AGADRYLLREETSVPEHYAMLHPKQMNLENRLHCLEILKETGYQTGCGFMVGSPGWQLEYLARELCYIKKLRPHMIGIGPFIPHKDTVFAKETGGSLDLTLNLVAMLRLMNPNAMIPATTAVGTIDPRGREKAILSGANVVMPNLSPVSVRKNYMLYDNKLCTGDEAAECRKCLDARIRSIGYEIVTDRGDYREF